jgi:Glyoxalase superfamily protein
VHTGALQGATHADSITRTIPILAIFSVEKAKESYLGWLGFSASHLRHLKGASEATTTAGQV